MSQRNHVNTQLIQQTEHYSLFKLSVNSSIIHRDVFLELSNKKINGFRKGMASLEVANIRHGEETMKQVTTRYVNDGVSLLLQGNEDNNKKYYLVVHSQINNKEFVAYVVLFDDHQALQKQELQEIILNNIKDQFKKSSDSNEIPA